MNAKRLFIITLVLAAIFAAGISTAAVQSGKGKGNGGSGNGTGTGTGSGYQGGQNGDVSQGKGNGSMNSGSNGGGANGGGLLINLPPGSVSELPDAIIDLMLAGWTDEQHAYAVYGAVLDQFGTVRPFTNIQTSEAQHIAAWEVLFDRYGITVPDIPTFDLPVFASVSEACAAGAAAEVANFDLYDSMLEAFAPYPDLLYVAQNLRDASEFSHLPAFENCAG